MPLNFSVIQQDPTIRALVQDNSLVRQFRDPLLPRNLFRGEAMPVHQPGNAGDFFYFTGAGLMTPNPNPRNPQHEPQPKDYQKEQWSMQLHEYYDRCPDTHMPTSIVAIVNLLNENLKALGLNAGQTLNRAVRDKLYNAGLSGQTVASANVSAASTIPVVRLKGFTTARRPDLANGSPVAFQAVSSSNPLSISYVHSASTLTATVVGFTPTYAGDEVGPGTLTVLETVTLTARDPIFASDASFIVRGAAGANSIDALTSTSTNGMTYDLYRQAIGRLEDMNVPKYPDGYYHVHMNSYSKGQLFGSTEQRQLLTSLPDHYWFKRYTLGEVLGGLIFNDTECPRKNTVVGGATNVYVGGENGEMFAGETINASSLEVQRPIFLGAEAVYEYYNDLSGLITEAGVCGVVGEYQPAQLTNNGVEINVDRVQVYVRAPVNVKGDIVTSIWRTIMDWPTRTDATTGDAARHKRTVVVEHV
jgi:hypothetical protein